MLKVWLYFIYLFMVFFFFFFFFWGGDNRYIKIFLQHIGVLMQNAYQRRIQDLWKGGAGNPNSLMPAPENNKNRPKKQKSAKKRGGRGRFGPPPPPPPGSATAYIYIPNPKPQLWLVMSRFRSKLRCMIQVHFLWETKQCREITLSIKRNLPLLLP